MNESGALLGSSTPSPCAQPLPPSAPAPLVEVLSPAGTGTWLHGDLESLVGAFGTALEAADNRRSRDALHTLLDAHQEQLLTVVHALHEHRHESQQTLERAVEHLVVRMAEELTPSSIMGIGELFRESAGEITGAMRRNEHLQGKTLEALGALSKGLAQLSREVANLRSDPPTSEPKAQPDNPRLALVSARGPSKPARQLPADSPLNRIPDDM